MTRRWWTGKWALCVAVMLVGVLAAGYVVVSGDLRASSGSSTFGNNLTTKIRVLCIIPTSTRNLATKASVVRDTWAKWCDRMLFFSEKTDTKFPTVGLPDHEGFKMLTSKMRAALTYVHDNHLQDADWFLKADDDTYVIVENLRFLLSHYDHDDPVYLGHHFKKYADQGYMSGGAGYVLSKEALRRLVGRGYRDVTSPCRRWGGAEDAALGQCLQSVGVTPGVSLDLQGRQTFHPFNLLTHLSGSYPHWYYEYSKYDVRKGLNCCSDFSISFHFVEPNVMRIMHHFLYHTRVYDSRKGTPLAIGTVFKPPNDKLKDKS